MPTSLHGGYMQDEKKGLKTTRVAVIICILISLLFILGGNLDWETNDDELLNLIAAGAWGFENSQYLIYQNIVLGYLYKFMYQIIPTLNVYAFFFLTLNVLSYCLICRQFAEKHSMALTILFATGVGLLLHSDFFETIQYTKNAYLYAVTGWIYLWSGSVFSRRGHQIIGFVMLGISFMVRWQCCVFTVPFILAWILIKKGDVLERKTEFFKGSILLLLIWVALFAIDKAAYSSPEWKAFSQYNKVRTSLLDYGTPSYKDNSEVYDEIGITDNDIEVMMEWNYGDNKVFSYENLSVMDSLKEESVFSLSSVTSALMDLYSIVHSSPLPVVLFMIMACLVLTHNKEGVYISFLFLAFIFLEYVFLNNFFRLEWRVEIGIWFVPIILLLFTFKEEEENAKSILIPAVLISLCSLGIIGSQLAYNFMYHKHFNVRTYNAENRFDDIQKLYRTYPYHTFIGDTVSFSSYGNRISYNIYDVTKGSYSDLFSRFNFAGCWMYPSPLAVENGLKSGITNPLENLLDDNVCFVVEKESYYGDEIERILVFLQTHYDKDTEYEIIGSTRNLTVVKYKHGS